MYSATTLGFSALHGPHHEAQKSTIVTLPAIDFKDIILPSGFGPEKSVVHLPAGAAAGAGVTVGAAMGCGFL